jgi:HlyD family secretion protein
MTPTRASDQFAALFPGERPEAEAPWWRRRRGALAVALVAIVLVVALMATQAFGSSGPGYRTAMVGDENVDALLTGVGTIEPVSQATIAFPVAGTVASVGVQVGDTVTPGQPLASLDTQSLQQTVDQKQAALAQAQLNLSKALSGQAVTGGASGGAGANASATGTSGATTQALHTGTSPRYVLTAASADPALAQAQQAVLAAQQKVDAAISTASSALTSAQTVCASISSTPPSGSSTPAGSTTTTGPTDPTTTTTPPSPSSGDLTACQTALQQVLAAQNAVAAAQNTLVGASNALDALLAQRAASTPSAPTAPSGSTGGSGGSGSFAQGGGGSSSSGSAASGSGFAGTGARGSGSTSSAPSAADLASYQQAVDAATDQVAVAQQALAQATVASPIAGTVVAVNLTPGASVTSASSTADIVVQGSGGYEVSTTVGVDKIPHVHIGDTATVVPDGTHKSLTGKVASISEVPDANVSTTSYLVVIGLTDPNVALNNGATGTTTVVTDSAKSALAVPTSAVTTNGGRHTVEVLDGDTTRQVTVQVGVMGAEWTEVKSGLTKGQQVVLADASQPLPGSATSSSNGSATTNPLARLGAGGGFGGFGGAGLGGGGFRGAGATAGR